jgi:hypothetical protein
VSERGRDATLGLAEAAEARGRSSLDRIAADTSALEALLGELSGRKEAR